MRLETAKLVAGVARGDTEAFDTLWERYRQPLRVVVFGLTRNGDEAEEVLQETAVRAWRALERGRYQHRGQLLAWLCRIARNIIVDRHRRRHGEVPLAEDDLPAGQSDPSPEGLAITRDLVAFLSAQLDESLGCQDEEHSRRTQGQMRKLAFIWYYADGYTLEEVTNLTAGECRRQGLPTPSAAALNNWLGGGRLLQRLVEHLVRDHPDALDALGEHTLAEAGLTAREEAAWLEIRRRPRHAATRDRETMRLSQAAERKLTAVLTRSVSRAIHTMRSSS